MRPISTRLLIHAFSHIKGQSHSDGHSTGTGGTTTSVSGMWAMLVDGQAIKAYGLQDTDKMIVFFDNVNSTPTGHVFKTGDTMTYSSGGLGAYVGRTMEIRAVNPRYTDTNGELHHTELILK